MDMRSKLNAVGQALFDKKASNIVAIDVRGISTLTDYFIIAEGSVDRHVNALARTVGDAMHKLGEKPLRNEGKDSGDWVVVDFGDIVIHLLVPEMREKYALERLWHEGKIVDLEINVRQS